MPQHLDTAVAQGKRWGWHLVLFKDWLRAVEGGLTPRRYTKWLRTRKVFERPLIEFCQRLLGIGALRGEAPRLNEVGAELLEELARSDQEQAARQSEMVREAPGRDMPISGARVRRRLDDTALEAQNPTQRKPPSADDDPFLRALLDRFVELNPYLTRFTLAQIGEDFLSESELFRRIGSADFEARRPSMPVFQSWVHWLEWLGGVSKVGFRYRVSVSGRELTSYLEGVPLEELLAEDESEADPPEASAPAPAASSPPGGVEAKAEPGAPGDSEDGDSEDGDFDDGDFEDEGLDLPPEAEADPQAVPYWQRKGETQPEPVPQLAPQLAPQPAPAPAPAPVPAPEPEPSSRPGAGIEISSEALERLFGGDVSAPVPT
ncbi:MAG: hypothetical protein JKY65_07435, partial [Planctomycetes bacterium]|nr:hypothetical protein [Planctomycetota bacterium]